MIYLDNAATSFPKPNSVIKESYKCIKSYCANPGRSSHDMSMKTAEKIFETRARIADFLGIGEKADRVVFTLNASYALNFAIKSTLKNGDHALISNLEHNSVIRPVFSLKRDGINEYSVFDYRNPEKSIRENLRHNTTCIISTLSSNVTGAKIPIHLLSKIAKKHGLSLIVDASQTIGHEKIDLTATPCDVLCAPGHKALFGLQGCGFVIFNDDRERIPFIEGGSGNQSVSPSMPLALPERFEAGTLPSPSIISLNEGIKFIEKISLEAISEKLEKLSGYMLDGISSIKNVEIYGTGNGVMAFNIGKLPSEDVAYLLNRKGICTRAGLHCAPFVHRLIGTLERGAVRVSLSYFNKKSDIDALIRAAKEISASL